MVDVTVIIVNLNTKGLLQSCLQSVFADASELRTEVVVIDNGSTDGSVEMVRAEYPAVRLTVNAKNEGFARPNNQGMLMASGRYLFLLNSDAALKPGALGTLVSFLEDNPGAGACGPMLLYPDGRLQRSVKGFPSPWTHCCDMLFLDRLFPRSRWFAKGEMGFFDYNRTQSVDHVMASAFMLRREVFTTVGGFDERFFIYYNDMDWCRRIKQKGWEIYYVPAAQVFHHLGQTVGRVNKGFEYFEELYHNTMLYYQKHFGRWAVAVYKLLLIVGFSARSIGWSLYNAIRPSQHASMMAAFSRKTFLFGLRFWKPLPVSYT